jgi:hypothetical protein
MNTEQLYSKYVNTSFVKAVEPIVVERVSGAVGRHLDSSFSHT